MPSDPVCKRCQFNSLPEGIFQELFLMFFKIFSSSFYLDKEFILTGV